MNKYIGFKIIEAELMTESEFYPDRSFNFNREGYKVKYPDGYVSWSPKDVFEKAYMQVGDNNNITQQNVDKFIKSIETRTLGKKTTIVKAELINGFIIVESSSCVDEANYDAELGKQICLDRIKNKIWELLGFLLQTAKEGIK